MLHTTGSVSLPSPETSSTKSIAGTSPESTLAQVSATTEYRSSGDSEGSRSTRPGSMSDV